MPVPDLNQQIELYFKQKEEERQRKKEKGKPVYSHSEKGYIREFDKAR